MLRGVSTFLIVAVWLLTGCAPDTTTYVWQIGRQEDSEKGFDTDPHDDPERVVYKVGFTEDPFPSGLGTDIGLQRSEIEIQFYDGAPKGSVLVVRWSPGGSGSVEQFEAQLDGFSLGRSRELAGKTPYPWYTETFPLSGALSGSHSITLVHKKGDGLVLDFVVLAQKLGRDFPRDRS
jgi:hypothetical protein